MLEVTISVSTLLLVFGNTVFLISLYRKKADKEYVEKEFFRLSQLIAKK